MEFEDPPMFRGTCNPINPVDGKAMEINMQEAWKVYVARKQTPSDDRTLTPLDLEKAIYQHKEDGTIPHTIFHKLEKEDPALFGIIDGDEGTTLTSPQHGKGRVVACHMDGGYWVFTIKWGRKKTTDGKYTTLDVLREADEGQANTLKDTYALMGKFCDALLLLVKTHVPRFIAKDGKKKKTEFEKLTGKRLALSQTATTHAWDTIENMMASELLSTQELDLLKGDTSLNEELKKTRVTKILRFTDAAIGDVDGRVGLVKDPSKWFSELQETEAKVYTRAGQGVFRVGRVLSAESLIFPLCRAELPRGITPPSEQPAIATARILVGEESAYGLAMRTLIARALEGDGYRNWMSWAPVGEIIELTRPEEKGVIKSTSKHSNSSSKIRKGFKFLKSTTTLCQEPTKANDERLADMVTKVFQQEVANPIKVDAASQENRERKTGGGTKRINGRMYEPGDERWVRGLELTQRTVEHNTLKPIMDSISNEEIAMFLEVLVVEPTLLLEGKNGAENENHFMPTKHEKAIRSIIARLEKFVTTEHVSVFSSF